MNSIVIFRNQVRVRQKRLSLSEFASLVGSTRNYVVRTGIPEKLKTAVVVNRKYTTPMSPLDEERNHHLRPKEKNLSNEIWERENSHEKLRNFLSKSFR